MSSDFYIQIQQEVNKHKENIHRKDFRFFHIERFLKIAQKSDELSNQCRQCQGCKEEIDSISKNLSEIINDFVLRKDYDNKMNTWLEHLKKEHFIYPERYFIALYSFFGIGAGFIFGFLVSFLFFNGNLNSILVFVIVGLFIGQFYGGRIDARKKNDDLII